MLKLCTMTLLSLLLSGCFQKEKLTGKWAMELSLQSKQVPFLLEFSESNVILHNSAEKRTLRFNINKDNEIIIPILGFDAAIKLIQDDNTLKGHWIKFNRTPEYKLNINGIKQKKKANENSSGFSKSFPKKWKLTFSEDESSSLLYFTESKNTTYASIITQTGDYRYMTPTLKDNKLILYGFDGAYSFYVEATKDQDNLSGTLYSGLSYNKTFQAVASDNFELKNPEKITTYKGDITKFSLRTLEGSGYSIKDNLGKVQVLQIFGSWCPNCIDETQFINNWRKNNSDLDIKFALLAFERSPNKEHALKQLRKAKANYSIDYPILVAGYTKEDKVENVLPGLEDFISFPTTIYIDKKGKIRKILASFQGPATGKYFDEFSRSFDLFLKKLSQE